MISTNALCSNHSGNFCFMMNTSIIDADYWNAMAAEYAAIHNKVHADEVYKGTRVMF